jgi:uncharacterized protein
MTLFLTLLPVYIFGNLHCLGMCGPLVMMLGHHRLRLFYFLGRLLSFGLAGMLAGAMGALLHIALKAYHLAEIVSLAFGGWLLLLGLSLLYQWKLPPLPGLKTFVKKINPYLSTLMLQDKGWTIFLFGFCTILLPCGQTLVVFSACAITGDAYVGLWNGLAFALLTSPALVLAMHTHSLFKKLKRHYNTILGMCSILVGGLAICRGLAEAGMISHLILNPEAPIYYHIMIY